MKIRAGFVSNSSSSSFVIVFKKDIGGTDEYRDKMIDDIDAETKPEYLKGIGKQLVNWLFKRADFYTAKEYFENEFFYGTTDEPDYEDRYREEWEDFFTWIDFPNLTEDTVIGVGDASHNEYDSGIEAFVSQGIDLEDDNIRIWCKA